jgi:hypothetical protein
MRGIVEGILATGDVFGTAGPGRTVLPSRSIIGGHGSSVCEIVIGSPGALATISIRPSTRQKYPAAMVNHIMEDGRQPERKCGLLRAGNPVAVHSIGLSLRERYSGAPDVPKGRLRYCSRRPADKGCSSRSGILCSSAHGWLAGCGRRTKGSIVRRWWPKLRRALCGSRGGG